MAKKFPDLTGDFSITAWIRTDATGSGQRIFVDDANNSGGFALSLGDPGNGRLRFFSRGVSPISLDTGTVISTSTWHHVAIVHDSTAKTRTIYVDGTAEATGTYTGTWGSDSGMAAIGGEIDSASEGNSNFRFDGFIDEVRVYDAALSSSQITSVMNDTHSCPVVATPLAYFELDEFSLDGTSGELVDNIGTSTTGRAINSGAGQVEPNADGKVCYGVDIGDNDNSTNYAIDTGLDVDSAIGGQGSINFWYRSTNAWINGGNRILFDASTSAGKFFYLYVKDDGKLRFGLEDSNDSDTILETPVQSINAGTWVHVGVTWDLTARSFNIYIDGVSASLTTISSSGSSVNLGNMSNLQFGDTSSSY